MKKIALGVIMILMMSLIGCSKGNDGEPESTSEVTGDLTQEQTTEEKLQPAKGLINDNKAPFSLTLLGHASTKIVTKSGVVIYIDPYYDKGDYSQEADLILVMDNGRIIERGTHKELMEQNGYYAEAFRNQYGEIPAEILAKEGEVNGQK